MSSVKRRECATCKLNRNESRYTGPRGTVCDWCRRAARRASARRRHLADAYEITQTEYDAILAIQENACGACGEARAYNLAVDHDHAIEKLHGIRKSIRGLLCKRCNKVLRDVRDSTQVLRGLARYLDDPPARKVIHG